MTVDEMADYVCEVYGKTDTTTKTLCKKFLRHRYRMICDSALWKDLLGVYSAPVSSRVVYLPEDVDRVIHVVFDGTSMDVNDLIRDSVVNPQNISTVDSELGATSTQGTEVTVGDNKVRVQDGVLQIQDPDTLLWYDLVARDVSGGEVVSLEGDGES